MNSNVGIGDNSLRFVTGPVGGEWKVVPWNGRFAVCKFSNERMRITADGGVMFGDTLHTPDNALEVYWFNTREWADLANRRLRAIDSIAYPKITIAGNDFGIGAVQPYSFMSNPPQSEWECYLFGNTPGGGGMVYKPAKGREPNAFVRWCMNVMLACKWVKSN